MKNILISHFILRMGRQLLKLIVFFLLICCGCVSVQKKAVLLTIDEQHNRIIDCLTKGVQYYRENKPTKARQEFEKIFSVLNIEVHVDFKEIAENESYRTQIVKEYVDRLEPLLINRSSGIQIQFKKGMALYESEQYRSAIEYFANVLVLYPQHTEAKYYIVQANKNMRTAEKVKEKKRLQVEAEKRKKKIVDYYKNGINLYKKNKLVKAYIEFKEVLKKNSNYKDAKKYFDIIGKQLYDMANDSYKEGLAAYTEGNIERAISLWEETLCMAPNHLKAQKAIERARVNLNK